MILDSLWTDPVAELFGDLAIEVATIRRATSTEQDVIDAAFRGEKVAAELMVRLMGIDQEIIRRRQLRALKARSNGTTSRAP